MKMVALLCLLAGWVAVAEAAAHGAPPKASGELPVPEGWHIVAFTSPKAADKATSQVGEDQAASSPEASVSMTAASAPELTVLKKLTDEQETETKARAAREGPAPDAGNMLAEALGNVAAPAAEPEAPAASSNVEPPASNVDGLQIPPGYRIEGLTPALTSSTSSEVSSPSLPAPDAAVVALDAAATAATAAPDAVAAAPDAATVAPEAAAQDAAAVAPDAAAAAPEASMSEKLTQMPPPPVAASSAASPVGVDGLQVPAGWKITAILPDDDGTSSDSAPVAKPSAQTVKHKAEAKVSPPPAVMSSAVSLEKVHAPVTKSKPESAIVATATPAKSNPVAVGPGSMAGAPGTASVESEPAQRDMASPKAVGGQVWAEDLDDDSGLSGGGPVQADEAASAMAEMGVPSMAQAAISKMLHYVRGDQESELIQPHLPPAATLGHITSVDCLTATIGGLPCNSEQRQPQRTLQTQAPVTPQSQPTATLAAQRPVVAEVAPAPLFTKSSAHPLKSIQQVASAAPPLETHTRLRAGHAAPVTIVHDKDEQVTRKVLRVVVHKHRGHHDQQQIAKAPAAVPQVPEGPSMADLVSQQEA